MSRMPMGKVLLRNVIRHTDAHNKIQEESEMWKLRDMEKQAQEHSIHGRTYDAHLARGSMHCDRVLEEGPVSARDRLGHVSEREEREARYWTRKLYEFEANDPDRWGHSGFKELYPEEFQTDGEKECSDDENVQHQKRKGKASLESSDKHKHSKKSSRKKKKKKKKSKRAGGSEVDGSSSEEEGHKPKRRKRSSGKAKHRRKKREKQRERKDNGSTADSDSEEGKEKQICIPRKRAKEATGSPEPVGQPQRKRRNWKVTNEEKSEDSSED